MGPLAKWFNRQSLCSRRSYVISGYPELSGSRENRDGFGQDCQVCGLTVPAQHPPKVRSWRFGAHACPLGRNLVPLSRALICDSVGLMVRLSQSWGGGHASCFPPGCPNPIGLQIGSWETILLECLGALQAKPKGRDYGTPGRLVRALQISGKGRQTEVPPRRDHFG